MNEFNELSTALAQRRFLLFVEASARNISKTFLTLTEMAQQAKHESDRIISDTRKSRVKNILVRSLIVEKVYISTILISYLNGLERKVTQQCVAYVSTLFFHPK